ncbi:MAG: metallophosphoesterase [Bacteroidota bacterium]
MRILALADIHGDFSAADGILEREPDFDVLVLAGDVTTRGRSGEVVPPVRRWCRLGKPLVAVAGNMDTPAVETDLAGEGVLINGVGRVIEGVGFTGVSASPLSPLRTPNEVAEDELERRAEAGRMSLPRVSFHVLVSHAPPYGVLDATCTGIRAGSRAIREFVLRRDPALVLCGHIHEARGTGLLGKTLVANCGCAAEGYYCMVTLGRGGVSVREGVAG